MAQLLSAILLIWYEKIDPIISRAIKEFNEELKGLIKKQL